MNILCARISFKMCYKWYITINNKILQVIKHTTYNHTVSFAPLLASKKQRKFRPVFKG